LYTRPIGWVMLAGMGVLLSVGVFWMSKVAKVDI
jgi:tight adherence protein B